VGILEPLELRPDPVASGHFTIVFGERRWRAAKLAGLATVPAIVNGEARQVRRRQLYENVVRVVRVPRIV
jgi:ParB family transcriptional regulator, chromosome partitioning protein